ncbi:MAG: phosphatase PAP2 family protein [Bacteroidia bacterium]
MFESLMQWDYAAFRLINGQWVNPVLDLLMPALRDKFFWAPVYAFFLTFLGINFRLKGLAMVLLIILSVTITDQVTASYIKPRVERLRPCHDANLAGEVRLLINCGSGKSFPSAHAANHFGLSFFLIVMLGRHIRWLIPAGIIWAATVSYAQVYVGVHFPVDVIFGALIGVFTGSWIAILGRVFIGSLD